MEEVYRRYLKEMYSGYWNDFFNHGSYNAEVNCLNRLNRLEGLINLVEELKLEPSIKENLTAEKRKVVNKLCRLIVL